MASYSCRIFRIMMRKLSSAFFLHANSQSNINATQWILPILISQAVLPHRKNVLDSIFYISRSEILTNGGLNGWRSISVYTKHFPK